MFYQTVVQPVPADRVDYRAPMAVELYELRRMAGESVARRSDRKRRVRRTRRG